MKKRGRKTLAIEYVRVSGLGQVEGEGPDRQKDANRKFASHHGYEIDHTFFEKGVSGVNDIDGREALGELFDYIEEKDIKICLVEGADRLSRDLMVGEVILNKFRELGCEVVESRSGMDLTNASDNPTKTLLNLLLAAVAQFDKQTTVAKLASARAKIRKREGKCEGRKKYGEDNDKEREILEFAKALRKKPRGDKRKTYKQVAEALNEKGHTNRMGNTWTEQSVRNLLVRV